MIQPPCLPFHLGGVCFHCPVCEASAWLSGGVPAPPGSGLYIPSAWLGRDLFSVQISRGEKKGEREAGAGKVSGA